MIRGWGSPGQVTEEARALHGNAYTGGNCRSDQPQAWPIAVGIVGDGRIDSHAHERRSRAGENLKISGFGTFLLRDKAQRIGRNPKTGVEVPITPRRVLTFRASQMLKDRVAGR